MLREVSKVEQRYDAVLAVIREGMRVSEVAEKFGVHRPVTRPRVCGTVRTGPGPHPSRCPQ